MIRRILMVLITLMLAAPSVAAAERGSGGGSGNSGSGSDGSSGKGGGGSGGQGSGGGSGSGGGGSGSGGGSGGSGGSGSGGGGSGGATTTEVRSSAACPRKGRAELRVRSRDGQLRVHFELHDVASGRRWRIVVVHESRVEARVTATTRADDRTLEIERALSDFAGSDGVRVRASGPRGATCSLTVSVPAAG